MTSSNGGLLRFNPHIVPANGKLLMLERSDGEWVKHSEAASILHQQEERIAELTRALEASEAEGNHAYSLAVDDPGKNPPVLWRDVAAASQARVKVLEEALREALHFITNIDNSHRSVRLIRAALARSNALKSEGEI